MTMPAPATRRPWWTQAACRGVFVDVFYKMTGETQQAWELRQKVAKTICRSCPVRQDCYNAAVEAREPEGIWGGIDFPNEWRRNVRKLRAEARAIVAARASPLVPEVQLPDDQWS